MADQITLDPSEVEVQNASSTPSLSADEVEFVGSSTPAMTQQQASDAIGKLASHSDAQIQPEYSSPSKSNIQAMEAPHRESEAEQEFEAHGGGGYRIQPSNPNPQTIGQQVKSFQTPGKLTPTAASISSPQSRAVGLPSETEMRNANLSQYAQLAAKARTSGNPSDINAAQEFARQKGLSISDQQEAVGGNNGFDPIAGAGQAARGGYEFGGAHSLSDAAKAGTDIIGGVMNTEAGAFGEAAARKPLQTLAGYLAGVLGGQTAEDAAKAVGATPEEQEFANTIGFFLPTAAATIAGVKTVESNVPGGKLTATTAENLRNTGIVSGRVNGKFGASIFIGGKRIDVGAAQAPVADMNPAQVTAAQLNDGAISAMAERQRTEAAATAIVKGVPPAEAVAAITPQPPKPPMPQGMDQGILQPQTVAQIAQAISIAPPSERPSLVLEAHQNLAKWMAQQGRVMVDGEIHIVKTPDQAQTLAAKLVNAEVARQDEARNQVTEAQKASQPEEVSQPQNPNEPATDPQEQLYQRAQTILDSTDKPSVQMLQRNLRLGYGQARSLMDRWQQEKAAASVPTVGGEGHEVVEESKATIDAQMDALTKGNTNVVMLPQGSSYRPQLPDGFKAMDVKKGPGAGTYIYNPQAVKPSTIRRAAENGTHGDLLGHVQTKEELQGKPTAIVQASTQDGTPIQDSAVDATNPQAIQAQAEVLQERHPEAQISVKPADQVIQERLNAQEGGAQLSSDEVEESPQERMNDALDRDREALTSGETERTNRPLFAESIKESQRQSGVAPQLSADEVEEAPTHEVKPKPITIYPSNMEALKSGMEDEANGWKSYEFPHGRVLFNPKTEEALSFDDFNHPEYASEQAKKYAKENQPAKYKFGSTQANLPAGSDAHKAITDLQSKVADTDLAGDGKDIDKPHVTVRYGILGDDYEDIRKYLSKLSPFEAKLGKTEKFEPSTGSDGAAVIQAPVESPELHRINDDIAEHGDFKAADFDYKPHVTVAYVKPEAADKYVGMADAEGKSFPVNSISISDRHGNQEEIQLGGQSNLKGVSEPEQESGEEARPAPTELSSSDVEHSEKPDTLSEHLYRQVANGNMPKDNIALRRIVGEFDGKMADNARMKVAQEDMEAAIARRAREIISRSGNKQDIFDELVKLYESQPSLNIRTSTSVQNQAYSTPAPLAFVADRLAGVNRDTTVYEPTAGNGMLLIAANPRLVRANELDPQRAARLREQGYKVTEVDAVNPHHEMPKAASMDAVVANPPFGGLKNEGGQPTKALVDGFKVGQLDQLIVARALDTMKDDGKATLILGAQKTPGGISSADRIFFNWLYSHYNVTSHFEIAGSLYGRQGANWPVRVINIDGRAASENVSPEPGTIQRVDTWKGVYDKFIEGLGTHSLREAEGRTGSTVQRSAENEHQPVPEPAGKPPAGTHQPEPAESEGRARSIAGSESGPVSDSEVQSERGLASADNGVRPDDDVAQSDRLAQGQPKSESPAKRNGESGRTPVNSLTPEDTEFQVAYTPASGKKDVGVLIPTNMRAPLDHAMRSLEDAVGNIDEFVKNELAYESTEEMHDALMGLQVDSVAAAIYQIKQGKAIVIGDQTGIGKGRQAAAVIRWAEKQGKVPVFMTVKPQLFTDMYGDLSDIGSFDIAPFILNADEAITLPDGKQAFGNIKARHKQTLESIAKSGELPSGKNALFGTYSQINVENMQRGALEALAHKAVFVLDESHNAGGESSTGEFIRGVIKDAAGVTYLSATYAKRPDNMPLYFKTDIGEASGDNNSLIEAMKNGGLPLQTVVSNNLVQAGQFFRRERSYAGVEIATKIDTARSKEHAKLSDRATEALRSIVEADRTFHNIFVKKFIKDMVAAGELATGSGNKASQTVSHTEFTSIVHNFVRQMLLGLKADTAADDAIESIKRGEKPLIAVDNTMGSFLSEYAATNNLRPGNELPDFSYRTVLQRALDRTRFIMKELKNGDKVRVEVPLSKLDPQTREAYRAAQKIIDAIDIDIPASPIDWIRYRLQKAGHSVAEITGRDLIVDYSTPEQPKLGSLSAQEKKDKVETTRRFNDGRLDAIVLNVAGSTGISLHASERFKDQRQRHMIVAQPAQDINIFMQMLGRVHRTGQVKLPKYTILSVDLPAEKRPTALLSKKMKSLNANTSSNTESATSVKAADMLNKYGDEIVSQYLADNPKLADALRVKGTEDGKAAEDTARDATGRLALMPVKEQQAFYDEVEQQYNDYIKYLNETNQNELEPRTFDYDAKELNSQVMVEGTNPKSPFGSDAIYGEYSIKAQGKPLKPEEVTAAIKEHAPDGGAKHMQAFVADLDAKMAEYKKTLEPGSAILSAVVRGEEVTRSFLRQNPIGSTLRVSINDEVHSAAIVNVRSTYKGAGSPYALSKINVQLAVAGPMRFLSVPATQLARITSSRLYEKPESLFYNVNENARDTVKIVTGNLLSAFSEMKGSRGTIINFTKADGSQEQGIQLPKSFDLKANINQDYRLRSPEHAANFLQKNKDETIGTIGIASRDGDVRVVRRPSGLQIVTPKSKARGGRYFLDPGITKITGDFVSVGNTMRADIPRGKEAAAISAVMNKVALYASPTMAEEAKSLENAKPEKTQPAQRSSGTTLHASVFGADIAAKAVGKVLAHEFNTEVKPLLKKASTNADLALRELKGYLAPRSVTNPDALDVVMSALGRREKRAFVLERALDGYRKAVSKLSQDEQVAIGDRISLGQEQPTEEFEKLAKFMRSTGDDTYKAVVYEQARAMRPALANEWARLTPAGKDAFFKLHMAGAFGSDPDAGKESKEDFLERAQADPEFNDLLSYLPDGPRGESALYRLKEISDAALSYKKDYFGRIWKVAPGKDYVTSPTSEPERTPSSGARGPLQGRKRFLKQQTLPTLAEGIARGGVPYSYNPLQMFKAVQAEHYRYITALQIWNDAFNSGARVFVKRGDKAPEGFSFVEDRIGDVKFPAASGEGMIEAGKWALRDDYARILNNFLSKDWIRKSSIGRGLMWTKNQLTAWRLGFSPFHAFTTATSAISSRAGLGYSMLNRSVREMDAALAGKGATTLATAAAAPYLDYKVGSSVFKYVENPSEFIKSSHGQDFLAKYPNLDQMIDAAFAGGAKLALHQDERLHSIQAFREAVAEKKALAALFHAVPALNQFLMTPLFEYYIPRVKFGSFLREYSEALADRKSDIASGDMTHGELSRKTWDSVEDVFGQMNWDKFFWHNTFKAAVQLAFRAFTWFAGNARLVGRAAVGQAREMYDSLAYLHKQFRPNAEWRPKYASTGAVPRIHPDMAKLLGLATTFIIGNLIIQKLLTGENPEDWKDYVAARIGGYDEHGRPHRIVLPAIVLKDMMSLWYGGAANYMKGKESDLLSGISDVLSNEDFRHVMVHNPESGFWKQRLDDVEHIIGSPIGVGNVLHGGKEGEPITQRVLTGAGFSNAPRQMDMTPAENKMLEIIESDETPKTQEEIDEAKASHQALLRSHTAAGRHALAEARKPDVERMFEKLTYIQARDIYENYANAQERHVLKPLLDRKRANLLRRNPGAVRQADANE